MLKIKDKELHFNRGDKITIQVACSNAKFEVGDYVTFYITEAGNTKNVLFSKQFSTATETNVITIELSASETEIGENINTGYLQYWYEIDLNDQITLVGYDENGPKLVYIYPESEREVSV